MRDLGIELDGSFYPGDTKGIREGTAGNVKG